MILFQNENEKCRCVFSRSFKNLHKIEGSMSHIYGFCRLEPKLKPRKKPRAKP